MRRDCRRVSDARLFSFMFPALKGRAKFNAPLRVESGVVSMSMPLS